MSPAFGAPSSGPSGHLLPAGEKRELAVASPQVDRVETRPTVEVKLLSTRRRRDLFSPAGRRWRVAPDEGVTHMAGDQPDITKRRPGKTDQARSLRQNETEAEFRLWSDLRNRQLNGYKFSRQVPLGVYVADFVCRERHLIVELDGSQHAESVADGVRTRWLNDNGYSVLRFWNDEVLKERRAVLETILAVLEGRIVDACETIRFSPAKRENR
ncbi:MAG: endonuclease domain-containing protein [Allorhizobium sp.]